MDELTLTRQFVALSCYAGSRFDLVQAGGGNSSVKLDGNRMLVKASGVRLSDLQFGKGYAEVDYPRIVDMLSTPAHWQDEERRCRDIKVAQLVNLATNSSDVKASIEVFLHALLGRFVLHTHPIAVNVIASQSGCENIIEALFADFLCLPYYTPGIELGIELDAQIKGYISRRGTSPQIIFLQNHGLIVSAESADEVRRVTEDVIRKCEEWCHVDLGRYRSVTAIAEYVGGGAAAYLCEDQIVDGLLKAHPHLFSQKPFCPDSFVFCGVVPLIVEDLSDAKALEAYRIAYRETPKVINYKGSLYFVAQNIRKAKEIEDVYKAHLLALVLMEGKVNYLSDNELDYLGEWEAEKYREGI
ncbi:MAG: class II aldolase [Geobacter sp.]|nr:class II aldolase [Geobacter sp.]